MPEQTITTNITETTTGYKQPDFFIAKPEKVKQEVML